MTWIDFNGRLTRLEYLFWVTIPILLTRLYFLFADLFFSEIIFVLSVSLTIWIVLVATIMRGRDSGLNALLTLLLFFLIPIILVSIQMYIDSNFSFMPKYLYFIFYLLPYISFPLYLLFVPSSKKGIKEIGKVESILLKIIILLLISLNVIGMMIPATTCRPIDPLIEKRLTCTQLTDIHKTLKDFYADQGTYPTTEEGLEAFVKNPNPKKYKNYPSEPYYNKLPKDTWRELIHYRLNKTDRGEEIELRSFGEDRKYGGEEENADIVYPGCVEKKEVGFFERVFK